MNVCNYGQYMSVCNMHVCVCALSQLRDLPLEVNEIDTDAARKQLKELSVSQMTNGSRKLRSNRFVHHPFTQLTVAEIP